MSNVVSLLPVNATPPMRAVEAATARVGDVPVPVRALWDAATCPAHVLPWLAWALGVDEWIPDWSDDVKRDAIAAAIPLQRYKGSVASIKRAIALAGLGDATLLEGTGEASFDGTYEYNSLIPYGDPAEWARYRLLLLSPITNAQADQVRRILRNYAPARCHLVEILFVEAAHTYNSAICFDGSYNYGVA